MISLVETRIAVQIDSAFQAAIERIYSDPRPLIMPNTIRLPEACLTPAGFPHRGGIPVCWPQFSDFGALSSHGFARNSVFELQDSSADSATLVLRAGEDTPPSFPYAFELKVEVRSSRGLRHFPWCELRPRLPQ